MKKFLFVMWSVVAMIGFIQAQPASEPEFIVKLKYDTVGLNENFQVEYLVKNAQNVKFLTPDFRDFQIVSGPFQSSQFSMVNGTTSSSSSYTFILKAKETGIFVLPAQEILVSNDSYKSDEKEIVVLDQVLRNDEPYGGNNFGFEFKGDIFDRLNKQQDEMMKRNQDFFNNPDGFFGFPKMFDFNEMFKNFDQSFEFKVPQTPQPQKPKEKTYKL
jgi:hypothetical protein